MTSWKKSVKIHATTNLKVIKNILDRKITEDFDEDNKDVGDELYIKDFI